MYQVGYISRSDRTVYGPPSPILSHSRPALEEEKEEGDGKSKVAMQEIPLRAWAAGSGSSIDLPSAI